MCVVLPKHFYISSIPVRHYYICVPVPCVCVYFLVAILSMVQQTFACHSLVLEILCFVLLMLCDHKYSSDVRFVRVCVCVCVCARARAGECTAHVE